MPVLGSTALAGRGGSHELLSNRLSVLVRMLIMELRSWKHLLTGMYASWRRGLPKEMPTEPINLKKAKLFFSFNKLLYTYNYVDIDENHVLI
jgi:hypothetical protein